LASRLWCDAANRPKPDTVPRRAKIGAYSSRSSTGK
jgi:hypothetical protein